MPASRLVTVAVTILLAGASVPPVGATDTAPLFEPADCPFMLPVGQTEGETVDCGYLVVPEDRSDPGSRAIRVAVAIFHPPGGATHPDPVVYLEGGPGGSPMKLVGTLRDFDASYGPFLGSGRDLILIDQRGVGFSQPALECPSFSEVYLDLFDKRLGDAGQHLSGEEMRAIKVDALAACAEELRAGADLGGYNTAEIAADVEDLRLALDYEELNLWGTSYGTWVALAAMRDRPGGLRSVILDAPLPPEANPYVDAPSSFARALDEVFAACLADDVCAEAFPDLEAVLGEAVARLDASPVAVEILDPIRGERVPMLIDGPTFLEQVFRALYQAPMRAALPRIIYDAREGVFDSLLTLAQIDVLRQGFRSWGMYYSVLCHDEVPFTSLEEFEAALAEHPELAPMYEHFEIGPLPFELCPLWDAGAAPIVESIAVESDLPVLVTTGQFDPIVPPAWGQHVSESLANASFHVFPGLAHGASGAPCATEMMLAFLDDPGAEVDSSCMASMPITPFDMPSGADTEITLEPFADEALGLGGDRPAGWTEVAPGQYARGASATDPTSLVLAPLPLSDAETLGLLVDRFGLSEAPSVLGTIEAGDLAWTRYATEAQGVVIDFALAPSQENTIIAVMTSLPAERDHLVEMALLPVIEGLRPLGG